MMASDAQIWDSVISKAIPFLDETRYSARHRRQSVYMNPLYKGFQHSLQGMWFHDQRQGMEAY